MQVSFTDKKLIHLFDLCAEYNATNVAHRYYLKFNGCKVSTKKCKIIFLFSCISFNGVKNILTAAYGILGFFMVYLVARTNEN